MTERSSHPRYTVTENGGKFHLKWWSNISTLNVEYSTSREGGKIPPCDGVEKFHPKMVDNFTQKKSLFNVTPVIIVPTPDFTTPN
jgi:hypothetical protein